RSPPSWTESDHPMTETFDVNATLGADELVRLTALQMAERLRAACTPRPRGSRPCAPGPCWPART
ncbi:hypothetical protein, partial [Micrococcus sp. HSID17245]|uniref:hypothetical protein n=1 Tax=Micrococcus sp. HSID17245 TaxID=2419508 RepID=UPI001EE95BEF